MKVKRYEGKTMQDTIFKVKADLGADAIIIDTRKIKKGGFFGFFGTQKVEVVAALEDKNQQNNDNSNHTALKEINEIKDMVNNLHSEYKTGEFAAGLSDDLQDIYKYLKKQGVSEKINKEIISKIKSRELKEKEDIVSVLQEQIQKIVQQPQPIKLNSSKKVVVFAGPTGVGKTTTIAKLAAKFSLDENKKVGLITADTYRIAAIQQLKTYSDIVNIPLKVLYDNQDLTQLIQENFDKYDLILVDTAGSSWNDKIQLGRLEKISNHELIDEVHLLVSINTKKEDIRSIIDRFSVIRPDKVLLTKLDETSTFGEIINISYKFEYPYSYITYGQDVPDDINTAYSDILSNYVIGDLK
ncbi:MAG: flagellar biosynthesis protein FlhF [Bacillota bacterium]